jgi:hypothetical protein
MKSTTEAICPDNRSKAARDHHRDRTAVERDVLRALVFGSLDDLGQPRLGFLHLPRLHIDLEF